MNELKELEDLFQKLKFRCRKEKVTDAAFDRSYFMKAFKLINREATKTQTNSLQ